MKKILLFVLFISVNQVYAQTVTIPDANFAYYLRNLIPAAMNGNQLDTTSTLVTTTTHSIDVSGAPIGYMSNLTGIQYFKSLTYLNCNSNQLITLPTLPNTLTYLDCGYNVDLTSLPALPATLTYLSCFDTKLTSLPALPNTLTYLSCFGNYMTNYLTYLPTLPNSLTYLDCSGHSNLSSLPTLPNSLQTLQCGYDNISCFPTLPDSITTLAIDPNPYTCLPNYISAMNAADLAVPLCAAGNTNGCALATGISQIPGLNTQISIYPNPNSGNFIIELNATSKQNLQVYDVNGRVVLTQTINGKTIIDAGNLPSGIYNASITGNEGVANKRLVITH